MKYGTQSMSIPEPEDDVKDDLIMMQRKEITSLKARNKALCKINEERLKDNDRLEAEVINKTHGIAALQAQLAEAKKKPNLKDGGIYISYADEKPQPCQSEELTEMLARTVWDMNNVPAWRSMAEGAEEKIIMRMKMRPIIHKLLATHHQPRPQQYQQSSWDRLKERCAERFVFKEQCKCNTEFHQHNPNQVVCQEETCKCMKFDEKQPEITEEQVEKLAKWLWKRDANEGQMVGDYDDQDKHWRKEARPTGKDGEKE